jgi:hypothetical protein
VQNPSQRWGGVRVLLRQDKAHFEAEMIVAFDKAKRLSDFIGRIVRLTFLMVFVAYFFTKANAATSWWWKYAYATTWIFSAAFTSYFWVLISRIILEYFMRDFTHHTRLRVRAIMFVISLYYFWTVTNGIYDIAYAIAQATTLIKQSHN